MKSICKNCKKEFSYTPSQSTGTFCGIECMGKYKTTITFEKNKEKFFKGKLSNRPAIKKILTEEFGYKCAVCNISNWQNVPLTLQVDHIDGNSDNNLPDNLRLLCPNCHSQTDTYKGGNKKRLKQDNRNVSLRKKYATKKELKYLMELKQQT